MAVIHRRYPLWMNGDKVRSGRRAVRVGSHALVGSAGRFVASVTPGWCYLAGDGQSGSVVSQNSSHRVYFNGPPASS